MAKAEKRERWPRLVFIVTRDNYALDNYLKQEFAGEEGLEVILDRRHGERRQPVKENSFGSYGFAIVHTHE